MHYTNHHLLYFTKEFLYFRLTAVFPRKAESTGSSSGPSPSSVLGLYRLLFHKRRITSVKFTSAHVYANVYIKVSDSSDFGLLGKHFNFPNMGDSLPWMPINHRAKFDATSFILGREIRNRTNTKKTNSKRYIHTLPIGMCG